MNTQQDSERTYSAEHPARELIERLGYAYPPREALAAERALEERARLHSLQASALDALLTGRVRVNSAAMER